MSFNGGQSQSMRLEDSPQFTHGYTAQQQNALLETQRQLLIEQGRIDEANSYPLPDEPTQ